MVKNVLIVFLSSSLFVGCGTIAKQYEADPIMKQQSDLLESDNDMVDTSKLATRISAVTDKNKRNELIIELVTISDRVCSLHQAQIISNSNTWNVATGTTTNILSALGTVLGGETTKAALAAGATFSSGSRSLINEEVYVEAIGTSIVRAISIARDKYYSKIEIGMTKPFDEYSITAGLRDVQEYHRRCSFYYGLLEVSASLEQRKKTKTELKKDIEDLTQYSVKLAGNGKNTEDIDKKINTLILQKADAPN